MSTRSDPVDLPVTPQDAAVRAADLIEAAGLCKGELWPGAAEGGAYRDGDPCCADGALRVVCGDRVGEWREPPLTVHVRRLVRLHTRGRVPVLNMWSDRVEVDAAAVVALLRAAARSPDRARTGVGL